MSTPPDADVLAANRAFYVAFNHRDLPAMEEIWAEKTPVSCVHPGWAPLFGRQAVLASWRAILGSAEAPQIDISDPTVVIVGQTAFVVCIEHLGEATVAATNVFVEDEAGRWRLVHHHGGPMSSTRPSRRPFPTQMN